MTSRFKTFIERLGFVAGGIVGAPRNHTEVGKPVPIAWGGYDDEGFEIYPNPADKPTTTDARVKAELQDQIVNLYMQERTLVGEINDRTERLASIRHSIRALESATTAISKPMNTFPLVAVLPSPGAVVKKFPEREEAAE